MSDDTQEPQTTPKREQPVKTCANLRLDIETAMQGKTWLLLPPGFRDSDSGATYPLPTRRSELQRLIAIPIQPGKLDAGTRYIKRAIAKFKERQQNTQSAMIDLGRRQQQAEAYQDEYHRKLKSLRDEAQKAADEVRAQADKAIASLTDLFSLGRKGLEGQMKAHLDGKPWQGEEIDSDAFRQCFRLVSQAVKGLGLPSTERETAREAIIDEVSAAMKATKEALAMAPGQDDEVKH
jgi:hypothetical protein